MHDGMRSQVFSFGDFAAATARYTQMLGCKPYLEEPFYVGLDVRGCELGLMPTESETSGLVTYWGVSEADTADAGLLKPGATTSQPIMTKNPHFQMKDAQ